MALTDFAPTQWGEVDLASKLLPLQIFASNFIRSYRPDHI
jgi:hypothetical protein